MTYITSRHRKSIIWWYENGVKRVSEIARHLLLDEETVQAVIDEHYREPEKPATDPPTYLDEAELAVVMFECPSCTAARGARCMERESRPGHAYVVDPHSGRVDMLRSLRAYCRGET